MKKCLSVLITILFSIPFLNTSLAVSIGPTDAQLTGEPGKTVSGSLMIGNTEKEPRILTVEVKDFVLDPDKNYQVEYLDDSAPKGLKNWIKFDELEKQAEPDEIFEFKYTVTIPANTDPGTYSTAIIASTRLPEQTEMVGLHAGAVSKIYLTVPGSTNEKLALVKFEINKEKLLLGKISFNLSLKNEGDVSIAPTGYVTLFDEKGEQIKGIKAIKQIFEEQEVITSREDQIPINKLLSTVQPSEQKSFDTDLEASLIEPGTYKAKLTLFYGEKSEKIEAETTFATEEKFSPIKFAVKENVYYSLPVTFDISLQNIGNVAITGTGNVEIKNIFGSLKKQIDLPKDELILKASESKNIEAVWENELAFGYYTATANITINGEKLVNSVSFWVINWAILAVVVVVVVLIVFLVYVGIKKYKKLKKKLDQLEKTKKE
jgi:hypothetical protein